jgi:hypothetical protein
MEYRTKLVHDEKNGRFKTVAYLGLLTLGVAFGYSWGMQNTLGVPKTNVSTPIDLEGMEALRDAAEQARSRGDAATASWYDSAMASHRQSLLAAVTTRLQRDQFGSATAAAAARGNSAGVAAVR